MKIKVIKVIDLLNKIANREKVPKKIKHNSVVYNWDKKGYLHYEDENTGERAFLEGYRTDMCLNDKVEIIEENDNEILSEEFKNIEKAFNNFYEKAEEFINKMKEDK